MENKRRINTWVFFRAYHQEHIEVFAGRLSDKQIKEKIAHICETGYVLSTTYTNLPITRPNHAHLSKSTTPGCQK